MPSAISNIQKPTVKPVFDMSRAGFLNNNNTNPFYTPGPRPGEGVAQSYVNNFNVDTFNQLADIQAQYAAQAAASNAGSGAARAAANDRLKFGLANIELQREGLGLDRQDLGLAREGLGLNRQTAALDQRDAMERVINNALQRGIFRSGIRIRNQERQTERADLQNKGLDLQEKGLDVDEDRLDVRGKAIELNEDELRASIKNALAGINAQASANRQLSNIQMAAAQEAFEMQRRQYLGEQVMTFGEIYSDASRIYEPRGIVRPGEGRGYF